MPAVLVAGTIAWARAPRKSEGSSEVRTPATGVEIDPSIDPERRFRYVPPMPRRTALEDGFAFEALSEVADVESWRKEIYRPLYHVHKWWAQRLGSVFRGVLIAGLSPAGADVMADFYRPKRFEGVVFDPFMGSGTTVGEAHKLGCAAIGRDVNPVAHRAVSVALGRLDRARLVQRFEALEAAVAAELRSLYAAIDDRGERCEVLYYFWVQHLPCPGCSGRVDLFRTRTFAKHAYPKKHPTVHVCCPGCDAIFAANHGDASVTCASCETSFDPTKGRVKGAKATCGRCGDVFAAAEVARSFERPPPLRMYAKLVLRGDGTKAYLPITDADEHAYDRAAARLTKLDPPLPDAEIPPGHNTKQVLGYGFTKWSQMFNRRQLLTLSLLSEAIADLEAGPERDALALLFSGALEFNNMFASYKGEGTGAVRHLFSHHILKPERMPIEANLWGTPKSSGAFSTLFKSRLLRALDYREAPFEVQVKRTGDKKTGEKVLGVSPPVGADVVDTWPEGGLPKGGLHLSCGSSASTDLPDRSVDLVVTDPPFFDNVHYSELADFFHVWQRRFFDSAEASTRHAEEVQDTDAATFASKLSAVFVECHRVLKDEGLLAFSYHHSRKDGWSAVASAVMEAGFSFVAAHPVKAELSVATPKSAAKDPIDLDVILVCRKQACDARERLDAARAVAHAQRTAAEQVARFAAVPRHLSRADVRLIVASQLLVTLSAGRGPDELADELTPQLDAADALVDAITAVAEARASWVAPVQLDLDLRE